MEAKIVHFCVKSVKIFLKTEVSHLFIFDALV